jgi:hypothetical protein
VGPVVPGFLSEQGIPRMCGPEDIHLLGLDVGEGCEVGGDLSKASQRFAVPGAHDGSARFRRGDGQLRVTEGHMLKTRAIPPASVSGTSFGSTVRSATRVVRKCCRDGGLQPRTKAADLKRSPHGASNGHRRRVLPCA